jgi:hypothetical protein
MAVQGMSLQPHLSKEPSGGMNLFVLGIFRDTMSDLVFTWQE